MVIESGLIVARPKGLVGDLKQSKSIQSSLGPRRHMATENFGHHSMNMCGCCMGKPSNGNQMFWSPKFFGLLNFWGTHNLYIYKGAFHFQISFIFFLTCTIMIIFNN
jgi:hypothetical protein